MRHWVSPHGWPSWTRSSSWTPRRARSGTHPVRRVHPRAVEVARRHELSLDPAAPRHTDQVLTEDDFVIAVCDNAHEQLPDRHLHWSVPDPARLDTDAAFEAAFTDIADRVDRLIPVLSSGGDDHV